MKKETCGKEILGITKKILDREMKKNDSMICGLILNQPKRPVSKK